MGAADPWDDRRAPELLRRLPVGLALLDAAGTVLEVNESLAGILAAEPPALVGRPWGDLVERGARARAADSDTSLEDGLEGLAAEGPDGVRRGEQRLARTDGGTVWVRVAARLVETDTGPVQVLTVEDVTARREAEQRLVTLAMHDSLTGLPNRRLLLDRLEQALSRSRRDGRDVAVVFLDLDHVKRVNDSLGHEAGDALLVTVARRLAEAVRTSDTVARIGGDEFVVVAEQVGGAAELERFAQRLLDSVRIPVALGDDEVVVTASVGVVVPNSAQDRPRDLLRLADAAMYRAKKGGRARFVLEHDGDEDALGALDGDALLVESELRAALGGDEAAGRLLLHYQPLVRVEGGVLGMEALLRWDHPRLGLIGPEQFAGALARPDLGADATRWVLRRAAEDAARWPTSVSVAVNVGADSLREARFAVDLGAALDAAGLDAGRVVIELVENQLADTAELGPVMRELALHGIRFAVDDFGAGYAGLAYVRELPVSLVKIDRTFVAGVADDPDERALLRAVFEACRGTGRLSVAEGVTTREQLAALRALGCDAVQGELVGLPGPVEDWAGLLTTADVAW